MNAPSPPASWTRSFDLLTLRLFLRVIEEGSLSRAATRERLTASAVTKRIQALEDRLGVTLLNRTPRSLSLTAAGEVVAHHVRGTLASLEGLHRELSELRGDYAGDVSVSANTSCWVAYLALEVAEFSRVFPMIRLTLLDGTTSEVIRSVLAGDTDVGICPMQSPLEAGLNAAPYRTDRLVAAVSPSHPAAEMTSLNLSQLLEFDLVGWSAHGSIMQTVRQRVEALGQSFRPKYRMKSFDSARALVRAGLGVAIIPDSMVLPFDDESRLVTVEIAEDWAMRTLYVITAKDRHISAPMRALVQHLTLESS